MPPPPPELEQPLEEKIMVEEYSNDNRLYSHDNLNTYTNEHDSLMVESILNMVKEPIPDNIEDEYIKVEKDEAPNETLNEIENHN